MISGLLIRIIVRPGLAREPTFFCVLHGRRRCSSSDAPWTSCRRVVVLFFALRLGPHRTKPFSRLVSLILDCLPFSAPVSLGFNVFSSVSLGVSDVSAPLPPLLLSLAVMMMATTQTFSWPMSTYIRT